MTPRRCFPVGMNLLVVHTARGARASVLSVFVSLTSVLSTFVSLIYVCQSDLCPVYVCQPDLCSNTERFKRTLIYFNTDTQ